MEDRREEYDPGRMLTMSALFYVGILIVFVCVIIGVQIWKSGEANTESWAALTGIIGWATAQAQVLFSSRFGSTLSNAKKDAAMTRMAEQSAPVAAAAVAANVAATAAVAALAPALPIVPVAAPASDPAAQPAAPTGGTQP